MSDLPFTLDQLRILHAISNEGSFKKAAEKLYISQPAVSKMLVAERDGKRTFYIVEEPSDYWNLLEVSKRHSGKFTWPKLEEQQSLVITRAQLSMLIEAIDWRNPLRSDCPG